jgi:hypothetical protein
MYGLKIVTDSAHKNLAQPRTHGIVDDARRPTRHGPARRTRADLGARAARGPAPHPDERFKP